MPFPIYSMTSVYLVEPSSGKAWQRGPMYDNLLAIVVTIYHKGSVSSIALIFGDINV